MIAYGVSVEGEVICIDHGKGGEIRLEAGKEELSEGNNRPSVVHYPRLRQPHPYESEAREKAGQTQERFPSLPEAQRATRGYGKRRGENRSVSEDRINLIRSPQPLRNPPSHVLAERGASRLREDEGRSDLGESRGEEGAEEPACAETHRSVGGEALGLQRREEERGGRPSLGSHPI